MYIKFYKCAHCGNIAVKVVDSGVPLYCCGEEMEQLIPDSVDAAIEKHVPSVTVGEDHVHVNVGSVDHPMEEDHYIEFICFVKSTGYEIHAKKPGEAPSTDFAYEEHEEPIAVYAYCNLHGLWMAVL